MYLQLSERFSGSQAAFGGYLKAGFRKYYQYYLFLWQWFLENLAVKASRDLATLEGRQEF
jgi:hypothetical protein